MNTFNWQRTINTAAEQRDTEAEHPHTSSGPLPAHAVALSKGGQYLVAGLEQRVAIYAPTTGTCLFAYPPDKPAAVAFHCLVASEDLKHIVIANRLGSLVYFRRDTLVDGFQLVTSNGVRLPYDAAHNDIHSLALDEHQKRIALGHLGHALSVLKIIEDVGVSQDPVLWRRHPDDGSGTSGAFWTVALDATNETLYAGGSRFDVNKIVSLHAASGDIQAHRNEEARITRLVVMSYGTGVVAALRDSSNQYHIRAYNKTLKNVLWEHTFDTPVTAMAADRHEPRIVISVGYDGHIMLFDSRSGDIVQQGLSLKSRVNGLAITNGSMIAAATQGGTLEYLAPASGKGTLGKGTSDI